MNSSEGSLGCVQNLGQKLGAGISPLEDICVSSGSKVHVPSRLFVNGKGNKISENYLNLKGARKVPYERRTNVSTRDEGMFDNVLKSEEAELLFTQSNIEKEPNGNNIEVRLSDLESQSIDCHSCQISEPPDFGGSFLATAALNHYSPIPIASIGNGISHASPGGSLDEHDCDDDKVMNGESFSAGDVPDPDSIKMFVGQVPKHLNEVDLRTLFEEFGRVFQVNVLRDKVTKQSKGCCFVTYYTRRAALDAQNALHNVKTLPGMNHPMQVKPADNENRYERKLFVGMLSRKCNEIDVRSMFSRYGVIDECTVLRDSNGQSKSCAFITFASKQCAMSAIKAVHHSMTMEGCSSPIVVKFADTQKDKDQKRHQQIQANLLSTLTTPVSPITPQYFSIIQQLQQQQQQQQQQQNSYFSQLSPLGVGGLSGLGSLGSGGATGLGIGSPHSTSTSELATLAALANLTNVTSNQHSMLGLQNLAALAALGGSSSLSPTGANGGSLASTNALASLSANGLHSGLNSYNMLRGGVVSKPVNMEGPEGANLFIYHLPPEFSDADLASMFTAFGNVISAKVFIDKQTNLSKCFGFVSFDNPLSAQLAIQSMNGFQVGMKRLKVQLKRSKEAAKPY